MYCGINWHTDVQKLVILDEWGMPFPMEFTVDLIPTAATAVQMTSANSAIGVLQTGLGNTNVILSATTVTANTAKSTADAAKVAADNAQAALNALPASTKFEIVTATLGAGGALNASFVNTYAAPPICIPVTSWSGNVQLNAVLGVPTTTGVAVTGKKSVGTIIIGGSPFTDCASGDIVKFAVIGR